MQTSRLRHLTGLLLLTVLSLGCASPAKMKAGSPVDIDPGFLSTTYSQQGQAVEQGSMMKVVADNPESAPHVTKAKVWGISSGVFAAASGFLIGWPIGTAIAGGDPEWIMAGIGGGVLALSIPLALVSEKQLEKGVRRYNENLSQSAMSRTTFTKLQLDLSPAPGGSMLGLSGEF